MVLADRPRREPATLGGTVGGGPGDPVLHQPGGDLVQRLCCLVTSQAMLRGIWARADQMAGLSSSNAVASLNTRVASTASS